MVIYRYPQILMDIHAYIHGYVDIHSIHGYPQKSWISMVNIHMDMDMPFPDIVDIHIHG